MNQVNLRAREIRARARETKPQVTPTDVDFTDKTQATSTNSSSLMITERVKSSLSSTVVSTSAGSSGAYLLGSECRARET
jgi:hypothetical protein